MSTVAVPVEVLLWVDVEEGTDEEMTERALEQIDLGLPGADGKGLRTFAPNVESIVTYATVLSPDLSLAVSRAEDGSLIT